MANPALSDPQPQLLLVPALVPPGDCQYPIPGAAIALPACPGIQQVRNVLFRMQSAQIKQSLAFLLEPALPGRIGGSPVRFRRGGGAGSQTVIPAVGQINSIWDDA